jgi:nucleoside-specific outer membrane channel protein Tsx
MIKKIFAVAVMMTAAAAFTPQLAHSQNWNDNQLRYWYGSDFREPGVTHSIAKNIFSYTHTDGGNILGNNFLNVDFLKSNTTDPAASSLGTGAQEVYVVYRHDVSLSRVTGKKLSFGPVRDLFVEAGVDLNTKNTAFAPAKRMPVAGPGVAFKIPHHGFLNVSVLWNKEWNNNGLATNGNFGKGAPVTFDSAVMLSSAWRIPINIGGTSVSHEGTIKHSIPLSFEGFASVNSPKGRDGFGNKTAVETLLHPKLMYNIGSVFSEKRNVQIGVGYEYWKNKFGNDHSLPFQHGDIARAPFGELVFHI